jgi:hypothetical protein
MAGYIYVISCGEYVKVGVSRRHPDKGRLQTLSTGMPYDLTLRLARRVANCYAEERRIHVTYGEHRVKGEWFQLNRKQITALYADIRQITEASEFDPGIQIGPFEVARHYHENTGPFAPEELAKSA